MSGIYLEAKGIRKRFGAVAAVDGVDLHVRQGELVALLGPSGCGKTTLLRILAGFEYPDAGDVVLDGRVLNGRGAFVPPERRRIGMVFQDYALFPHLDVASNVAFGMKREANKKKRVGELLDLVGLEGLGRRMPHELSGGQQQRVALARTLAPEPAMVLLDEPFSNLDPALRTKVRAEVRQIMQALGMTAVFVTHDQEEALSVAERVAVMLEGRIVQSGHPAEIYRNPATRGVAEFLGDANILEGRMKGGEITFALGLAAPPATAAVGASSGEGHAHVLVRPENLALTMDGGVAGVVVGREYYGHDQMVTVQLSDGTVVRVRSHAGEDVVIGAQVGVVLRGSAVIVGE
jgi:iron(III) transport system ATP-binding protein